MLSLHSRFRTIAGAFVAVALVLNVSIPSAARAPSRNFANRWAATPLRKVTGPNGPAEARAFIRSIHTSQGSFPVGSVTYLKVPKADAPDLTAPKIAEAMRQAMGFKKWNTRRQGRAQVFEADWAPMGRVVKVFVVEEPESIAYSINVFRTAYADTVAVEGELLQRQLAGAIETRIPWLEGMTAAADRAFGIAPAHAACPGCSALNPLACGECPASGLIGGVSPLPENPFEDAAASIDTLNDTAQGISDQTNGNAKDISDQTNQTARDINDTLGRVGDEANSTAKDVKSDIHRATNILDRLFSPSGYVVAGALTAAGAATGALGFSLLVDGTVAVFSGIYEAITHKKEDAERLAAFESAREAAEKLVAETRELEEGIDGSLYFAKLAAEAGSRENLILLTEGRLRRVKLRQESVEAELDRAIGAGESAACTRELEVESIRLKKSAKDAAAILAAFESVDHDKACAQMRENIGKLIKAENEMQHARLAVISGQSAWQSSWDARYRQSIRNGAEASKRLEDNRGRDIEGADENYEAEREAIKDSFQREFDACVKRRTPAWEHRKHVPIFGIFFNMGTRRDCRRELRDPKSDLGKRLASRQDSIRRAHAARVASAKADYDALSGDAEGNVRQPDAFLDPGRKPRLPAGHAQMVTAEGIAPDATLDQRALQKHKDWIAQLRRDQDTLASRRRLATLEQKDRGIVELCKARW